MKSPVFQLALIIFMFTKSALGERIQLRITNKIPEYQKYDIGDWTFGCPIIVECEGEQAFLHIGKFCSIADDVKILLGGEHNYRLGSTYPFDNLLIRFKELGPSVKTKGGHPYWK